MYIYVASSWRNDGQAAVVTALRDAGYGVYDFRHPATGDNGFHWSEIGSDWESWTPGEFIDALSHPIADRGFGNDMVALERSDAVVLVMPCGRSAHLELGYAIGAKKTSIILLSQSEPELMYKMADYVCTSLEEVLEVLDRVSTTAGS